MYASGTVQSVRGVFFAFDEEKSMLARDLDECRDNE